MSASRGFWWGVWIAPWLAGAAGAEPPSYHVAARYTIGGTDPAYDYLRIDPATRHLYVAHGTRVEVLDADSGAHVGQIDHLQGVHGIEIPDGSGRGFATSGVDRAVVMFDARSLQILKMIRYTGVKPDSIQYDPSSKLLFIVNGGATGDVTVVDPVSGAIVATIDLKGGKLEQIVFDGRGRGYVNDEERNLVHVLDTSALSEVTTWPLAPGEAPTGLAIDREHHRIFAACGNHRLVVIDTDSGRVLSTATIGDDPDGAAFEPTTGRVFTSNRDATLSIVREAAPGQFVLEQTLATASGARTIALDGKSGRLFLPTVEFGRAPAPTKAVPAPRAPMIPATFGIIVVAP